jgi:hypothetical protein
MVDSFGRTIMLTQLSNDLDNLRVFDNGDVYEIVPNSIGTIRIVGSIYN